MNNSSATKIVHACTYFFLYLYFFPLFFERTFLLSHYTADVDQNFSTSVSIQWRVWHVHIRTHMYRSRDILVYLIQSISLERRDVPRGRE